MSLHAGYAASRISSKLKCSTKQFGWLQASTTKTSLRLVHPRPHRMSRHATRIAWVEMLIDTRAVGNSKALAIFAG